MIRALLAVATVLIFTTISQAQIVVIDGVRQRQLTDLRLEIGNSTIQPITVTETDGRTLLLVDDVQTVRGSCVRGRTHQRDLDLNLQLNSGPSVIGVPGSLQLNLQSSPLLLSSPIVLGNGLGVNVDVGRRVLLRGSGGPRVNVNVVGRGLLGRRGGARVRIR